MDQQVGYVHYLHFAFMQCNSFGIMDANITISHPTPVSDNDQSEFRILTC